MSGFKAYKITEVDPRSIETGDVIYIRYIDEPGLGCFSLVGEEIEPLFPGERHWKGDRREALEEALVLAEEKAGTSD